MIILIWYIVLIKKGIDKTREVVEYCKKIWNLNKPFDEQKFIMQHMNQEKLKKNFTLESFHKHLPDIASYYVGL